MSNRKRSELIADHIAFLIMQHLQPITKAKDDALTDLKKALSFLDESPESIAIDELEKIVERKYGNGETLLNNKQTAEKKDEAPVKIEVYRGVDKGITYSKATLPEKKTTNATGYDALACFPDGFDNEITIHPGKVAKVPLGISMKIPEGYEVQIRPRSGLSSKKNVHVILGSIDEDYRGVLSAIVVNSSDAPITINDKTAICQLVVAKKIPSVMIMMDGEIDTNTERGTGGFGHTGNMGDN